MPYDCYALSIQSVVAFRQIKKDLQEHSTLLDALMDS
jgi:hypothetical protein